MIDQIPTYIITSEKKPFEAYIRESVFYIKANVLFFEDGTEFMTKFNELATGTKFRVLIHPAQTTRADNDDKTSVNEKVEKTIDQLKEEHAFNSVKIPFLTRDPHVRRLCPTGKFNCIIDDEIYYTAKKIDVQGFTNSLVIFQKDLCDKGLDKVIVLGSSEESNFSVSPKEKLVQNFMIENNKIIQDIISVKWQLTEELNSIKFQKKNTMIEEWIANFETFHFNSALKILEKTVFYSNDKIQNLIAKLAKEIDTDFHDDFSKTIICGLSSMAGNSGDQFLYSLDQKLTTKKPKKIGGIENLNNENLNEYERIIFIDDFIGSGNQAMKFCDNYLSHLTLEKYYYTLLGNHHGLRNVENNGCFKKVVPIETLTESNMIFHPNSSVFNPDEKIELAQFASFYGINIYPDGPLGYGNGQLLIAFEHNTPNNTLPIIWAGAGSDCGELGKNWSPLFPRIKKPKS